MDHTEIHPLPIDEVVLNKTLWPPVFFFSQLSIADGVEPSLWVNCYDGRRLPFSKQSGIAVCCEYGLATCKNRHIP